MRPVFFDRSGRRRRLAVVVGSSLATALLIGLGLLVAGLSGASPAGVPGFPDRDGPGAEARPSTTPTPPPTSPRGGVPSSPTATGTPTPTTTPVPTRRHGNPHSPTRTQPHPKTTKSA